MQPFLYQVAEALVKQNRRLDEFTVVFPNQRSILYFRKYLSQFISQPVFGPGLLTFTEFAARWAPGHVPDRLTLIYRLYGVYSRITGRNESFAAFFFWGNMLLRDFDELDKYLADPDHLLKDLSHIKELDNQFDYLTDEQKQYLKGFWAGFASSSGLLKKQFSELWQHLNAVYHAFNETLRQEGLTYEGRMFRDAATAVEQDPHPGTQVVFVGFNALTPAQEKIFVHAVSAWNAQVYWDVDDYYLNSEWQEAGAFFRKYRSHPVLGRTFPADVPASFQNKRQVKIYGTPQASGQAKILGQILDEALKEGMNPEEAVIVLPDEKMLLPVLHAVSGTVEKLNVSVSYPLSLTPVPSLVEQLAHLQKHFRNNCFYSASVLRVLSHPYLLALESDFQRTMLKDITGNNRLYVPSAELCESDLLRLIFRPATTISSYLIDLFQYLQQQEKLGKLDVEYLRQALRMVMLLDEVTDAVATWDNFMPVFRQLVAETRIPFVGEPLQGLPVIGMLETRNLDFRHVFLLSVNEGFLPPFARTGSYFPYSLRKAYGLPVAGHDEAITAYLFYRLMQRAETVTLFYTTEPDELGRGEMSRFLQQLLLETEPRIQPVLVTNAAKPVQVFPLTVEKTDLVWQQMLNRLVARHNGYLSPTSLSVYRDCTLQFYFKYVLDLREPKKLEEEPTDRLTGNVLHKAMELFYQSLLAEKGSSMIEPDDFANKTPRLEKAIETAMHQEFNLPEQADVQREGRQLLMVEVIKKLAGRMLALDRAYAPFELLATEDKDYRYSIKVPGTDIVITLGGQIDRIDRKDDVIRIIDYKTGRDEINWNGNALENLFNREKEGAKALLQTLLYALLFVRKNPELAGNKIVPGIMGRLQIFNDDFTFGFTDDIRPWLDEFEGRLAAMLAELFNREVPFSQTTQTKACEFCPFKGICYR